MGDFDNPFLSIPELRQRFSKIGWLVKGYIPAGATGLLFGKSGSFKTFLALDLCLHVALGMEWLGAKIIKGTVFYIAGEGGSSIVKRVEAWLKAKGLSEFPESIQICPRPFLLDDQIDLELLVDSLLDKSRSLGEPVLVVIDTLSQCSKCDEDSNTQISNLLTTLSDTIHQEFPKCTVLLLHHPGHGEQKRMRGASALLANTEFVLRSEKNKSGLSSLLIFEKLKDDELPDSVEFELMEVELGKDEDGDSLSSLAVISTNNFTAPRRRKSWGQYETEILRAFERVESFIEADLRQILIAKFTADGVTKEAASKGITRGIQKLIDEELISRRGTNLEKMSDVD